MAEVRIYTSEKNERVMITIDGQKVPNLVHYRLEQSVGQVPILWIAVAVTDKVTVKGDVPVENVVVGTEGQLTCRVCTRFKDICICADGPKVDD